MDPIEWLNQHAEGFAQLEEHERAAPMHFSLIWSHFEATALRENASPKEISHWVRAQAQSRRWDPVVFEDALAYVKDRYFHAGVPTQYFHSLNFKEGKWRDLAVEVLSGQNRDPVESVVALFLVIYRFRNNYFHGPKWAYHMHDQFRNFTIANDSLMLAMDMSRG